MQLILKFAPTTGTGFAALRLKFKDAAGNQSFRDIGPAALQSLQPDVDGTYSYTVTGVNGFAAGPCEVKAQPLDSSGQPLGPEKTFTVTVPLSEGGWIPNVLSIS